MLKRFHWSKCVGEWQYQPVNGMFNAKVDVRLPGVTTVKY
jgi:hypothetical protein